MDITQVVDIPASRKLTIDVPPGVPVGPIVIAYKPELPTKRGKPEPVLGCARGQIRMSGDFDAPLDFIEDKTDGSAPKKGSGREEDIVRELAGSWKDDRSEKWEIFMRGVNGFSDDFMAEGRLQEMEQERECL
ncbi:MAG: hypothetical protein LBB74_00225 [Chitinispirillales bacterium]|jgi:hypothetical protein|nr:hypothetical protein [Chitinispirillales bacterium]